MFFVDYNWDAILEDIQMELVELKMEEIMMEWHRTISGIFCATERKIIWNF